MKNTDLFLIFDVESIGLHGEGFAVGWVIKSAIGDHVGAGLFACPPVEAQGKDSDRKWVRENVPDLGANCAHPMEVRAQFWALWMEWKARGAVLVADCCWPVEARFLIDCVDDWPEERTWEGPYPLHDLASVLLAHGKDPLAVTERKPTELPAHHPANDAMQSGCILVELLNAPTLRNNPILPQTGHE